MKGEWFDLIAFLFLVWLMFHLGPVLALLDRLVAS